MGQGNFIGTFEIVIGGEKRFLLVHKHAPEKYRTVRDFIQTLAKRNFLYYTTEEAMVTARKEMYQRICEDFGHPKHGVLYMDLNKSAGCTINVDEYMHVDYNVITYPANVVTFSEIHDPNNLQDVADLPLSWEKVENW